MTISLSGSSQHSIQAGTAGNLTLTLPSGWQQYDYGLLVVEAAGDSALMGATISGASGWTLRIGRATATATNVSPHETWLWVKRLTATEADPVVTITNTTDARCGILALYREVDRTTAEDSGLGLSEPLNAINPTNPAVTTSTTGAAVILIQAATFPHTDGSTQAAPAGYTLVRSIKNNVGSLGVFLCVAHLLNAGAAGAKTPTAWQHSPATQNTADNHLITMSLRPGDPVFEPLIGMRHKQRFALRHF